MYSPKNYKKIIPLYHEYFQTDHFQSSNDYSFRLVDETVYVPDVFKPQKLNKYKQQCIVMEFSYLNGKTELYTIYLQCSRYHSMVGETGDVWQVKATVNTHSNTTRKYKGINHFIIMDKLEPQLLLQKVEEITTMI